MNLQWLCALPALLLGCASCPPCEVQTPTTPPPCSTPPERVATPDAAPRVRPAPSGGTETRTQRVIASVVAQNRQKVRACYEAERAKDPAIAGSLTLHFTLDPQGTVTQANVLPERSSLKQPTLHRCAEDALRTIAFPPSSRGFESQVNYPFDFKPQ